MHKNVKNHGIRKRLVVFTLLLTYIFSCPFIVNSLIKSWEEPVSSIRKIKKHDLAILLTGGLIQEDILNAHENLHLRSAGDRLWQALHLFQTGKVSTILISGYIESEYLLDKKENLSPQSVAKTYLLRNGVPDSAIILDLKAKNTNQNAINSAKIVKKYFP